MMQKKLAHLDVEDARARHIFNYLSLGSELREELAVEVYRGALAYTHAVVSKNMSVEDGKKQRTTEYIRHVTAACRLMEKVLSSAISEMIKDLKHIQERVYHSTLLPNDIHPNLHDARLQNELLSSTLALSHSLDSATRVQLAADTFRAASRYSAAVEEIHRTDDAIPREIMEIYNREISASFPIMDSLGDQQRNYVSILGNMRNRILKKRTY